MGCFYQFWFFRCLLFCCFSVGLKTFDCSFAFDLSELIAPLGLHARRTRLFSHALLNIQKWGGAQAFHPKEDNVVGHVRLCRPFPPTISSLGCHASLCKPAWFPGWLVVINYEQIRYKLGYVQNCRMRTCGV